MVDGRTPQGERYTQLSLIDMFSRGRGGGGGSRGNSSRGNSNSPGRGGPIRNRPSGSSRPSYGSDMRGGRDRRQIREEEQDYEQDYNSSMDTSTSESQDSQPWQNSDLEMYGVEAGVAPEQGTSSMLRAGPGGVDKGKRRAAHAKQVTEECSIISRAIFSQHVKGYVYNALDIQPLGKRYCPAYHLPLEDSEFGKLGCRIRVLNADSFACAEAMVKRYNFEQSQIKIATDQGNTSAGERPTDNGVVVLNMANAIRKGGGFLASSVAQEEALMHRSTLWHTLPESFYPLTETEAIYSPYVAIYKKTNADGDTYSYLERATSILEAAEGGAPLRDANNQNLPGAPLPELAIITIAAVDLRASGRDATGARKVRVTTDKKYADPNDKLIMEVKIREMLRIAALNGHRRLVLGAFGCGVFQNPQQEVANMFLTILREPEFTGGWWKEIIFGCFDGPRASKPTNYDIFHAVLHDQIV